MEAGGDVEGLMEAEKSRQTEEVKKKKSRVSRNGIEKTLFSYLASY